MPVDINIPIVDDALGHSVIYEEYKGNFAQARRLAEEKLNEARRQQDTAVLADALLARGIVHLLQGEPPGAIKCFQEIEQIVPEDNNRRLRAVSYANLATTWRYNVFPDGSGASATEIGVRWNGQEYLTAESPRLVAIFEQVSDTSLRFESNFVNGFLPGLQLSRLNVQGSYRLSVGPITPQELLQTNVQIIVKYRQTFQGYGVPPSVLAYTDLAAADVCQRGGQIEQGLEFLHRARETYRQGEDAVGAAACEMLQGDWLAAPYSMPKVWDFFIEQSNLNDSDLSRTVKAAEFKQDDSDLFQAEQVYAEAERLFRVAGAPRGLANVQLRRGYLALLKGDYLAAIDFARQALDEFQACGDRLGYWLAQAHRILSRIWAGQYPEEREIAGAIGAWGATEGSFSYALGLGLFFGRAGRYWLIREGDYERALVCYRLAGALYEALGAVSNLAQILVDQGSVYKALGERGAALTMYEQALNKYEQVTKARPSIAKTLQIPMFMLTFNIYRLYIDKMDTDGMERSANQLQDYITRLPGKGTDWGAIINLPGKVFSGLFSEGIEAVILEVAIFVLGKAGRLFIKQARTLIPLYRAVQARDAGDQIKADQLFMEALQAAHAAGKGQRDFLEAVVLGNQRAYDQAAAVFRRYMAKGGANAGFMGKLPSVLQGMGGEQEQRMAIHQQEITYNVAFTFMVHSKAYSEARSYLDQLIKLAGEDWWQNEDQPWLALGNYAEMYEGLGETKTALDYYARAIAALESRRNRLSRDELKTALVSERGIQYLYFHAARAALTLADQTGDQKQSDSYAECAFGYIERGKARALLDLIAGSAVLARSPKAESQTARAWRRCNAQLTLWHGLVAQEQSKRDAAKSQVEYLREQIKTQEAELRQIEAELAQSDPNFYQTLNVQAQIISLNQVRAALPPDTALLQYSFLGDDLLAWAITDQGMVQKRRVTVDAKALTRQVRDFHRACMDCQNTETLGAHLAEILLAPLAGVVRANSQLIVVPYGAAHALPFHALPWEGKPLAVTHTLSYLPSASTLQFVSSGGTGKLADRILAVGNPQDMAFHPPLGQEPRPLQQIPAAATEAAYVASLFREGKALIGDQATEPKVRELIADYPLLHFATHGVLSEETPLLSAILLAHGEALSVYELMGLQLNADLVVLSACRTALGEITGGDDVIGLTRGLLGAGARAVVVSLWPVNDVSTSLFMGEFFRQLHQGKTAAVALRSAQNYLRNLSPSAREAELDRLKTKLEDSHAEAITLEPVDQYRATRETRRSGMESPPDDYSHPFYWAPFVLVGSPGSIAVSPPTSNS